MIGTTLSHHRVLEKLGEGGMGAVHRARNVRLERLVALRVLPAEKVSDPDRRRRFVQEVRAASGRHYPGIVSVFDIDEADGLHLIVMELVERRTLAEAIGRKGLPVGEAVRIGRQIADAVASTHAAGIVHRDRKPANVMVTPEGTVKLLDFGLAKLSTLDTFERRRVEGAGRGACVVGATGEVVEDAADDGADGDEGDDVHEGPAARTDEGIGLVDAPGQLAPAMTHGGGSRRERGQGIGAGLVRWCRGRGWIARGTSGGLLPAADDVGTGAVAVSQMPSGVGDVGEDAGEEVMGVQGEDGLGIAGEELDGR